MNLERIADQLRQEYLAVDRENLVYRDFQKALPSLRRSKLYAFFRRMPKGRLMHAHMEATFDIRHIISLALSSSDIYVFTQPGTGQFRHLQMAHKAWFEDGTIPNGWDNLRKTVASEPALIENLFDACTFSTEMIDENIWTKFEAVFDRYKAINNFKPFFIKIYTKVLCEMAEEGLLGVDFRYISQTIFDEDGRRLSPDEYVDLVKEINSAVREKYPWFNVRLIYCYYKDVPTETVPDKLHYARHLQEKYPDVFIGFDMVGDEARGKDLCCFIDVLREAGVPLIMHAGESTDASNHNIETALKLGAQRIGHGLNLYHHPAVERIVNDTDVMLEVCPVSNQLLGYVPDLGRHPAAGYIKRGLNVTIGSDDCAIFDTTYLTDDLLAAYLCWDLTIADIKRCLINSLQDDGELLALFQTRWEAFENTESNSPFIF